MQCKCFSIVTLMRSRESFSFWRVVYSLGNLYQEHISQAIEIHLDPDATGPITMREISFLFTHFVFISKQMNTDKFLVSAYFSMSEIFAFKIENHSHTIYFAVKGELTSTEYSNPPIPKKAWPLCGFQEITLSPWISCLTGVSLYVLGLGLCEIVYDINVT